jgi:Tfp pilus assembly protein PilX
MVMVTTTHNKQNGAVSLFVVIFTMLLISIITVGFVRLMLRDQQQATTTDLSQSAYDSSLVGVEDGKRAILRYQSICAADITPGKALCAAAAAVINKTTCNDGLANVATVKDNQVYVQSNENANTLDQAYTCVKMNLQTPNYLGTLQSNQSKVVPLVTTPGSRFNTVTLDWYSSQDVGSSSNLTTDLQSLGSAKLPLFGTWSPNRPSLMRAQLMQFGNSFTLDNFDNNATATESNANTLYLYPSSKVGNSNKSFGALDIRKSYTPGSGPQAVTCLNSVASGNYACSVTLTIPDPIGGGNRTTYLRLSAFFNQTHYRLTLGNSGVTVPFDGVQPQIDSTGRANDLFRRVQSRVEIIDPAYPDGEVDITGSLCKDFTITDKPVDYVANPACTP